MKILKYKKTKKNEYILITDDEEITLYDDIIIQYELLLKKEITKNELVQIKKENNKLKGYYEALKEINKRIKTEKEIRTFLKKKGYSLEDIEDTVLRLNKEGYLNHKMYIEAYIHDMLTLYLVGESKICSDLIDLGFTYEEVLPYLEKIDVNIYHEKIKKYVDKKVKVNKKSIQEFKRKTLEELIHKGFSKEDVLTYLDSLSLQENTNEIEKIVLKLYRKYITKYDLYTTKIKIKSYLYIKGYSNVDIDAIIEKSF